MVIARFWCAYLRVRLSTGALINEYKKSARKKRKKNLIIFFRWCIFFFVYPFVHFIFLNLHQLLNRQKKYQNEHHFVRTQHHLCQRILNHHHFRVYIIYMLQKFIKTISVTKLKKHKKISHFLSETKHCFRYPLSLDALIWRCAYLRVRL